MIVDFKEGQLVHRTTTGQTGVIADSETRSRGTKVYWNVAIDGDNSWIPESELQPVAKDESPSQRFKARKFENFNSFRQHLTHYRIRGGLTNIVYSMKYGDVEFLPYQFKPVFKFITSNEGRLLIADEVGLGKTIEALYIWKELQAREGARRLIIVCPSMLQTKWQHDMSEHFGIDARIVKSSELLGYCEEQERKGNKEFALITSIQGIRCGNLDKDDAEFKESNSFKLNKLFEDFDNFEATKDLFDLAVFDEAQCLTNNATANYKTANRINKISQNLLLLSATPISNKERELFNLLNLLSPEDFNDVDSFMEILEENKSVVSLARLFYDHPKNNEIIKERCEEARDIIRCINNSKFYGKDSYFNGLERKLEEVFNSDFLRREAYNQISDRYFYSHVFSRSRKRDVMKTSIREAQTVPFKLTEEEREVYDRCTRKLKESCEENLGQIYMFAIMTRLRELASCIPATLDKWRNLNESNNEEDLYELYEDYSAEDDEDFYEPTISLPIESPEVIRTLEKCDTKYKAFVSTIKDKIKENPEEKIIVFSFFRSTLNYLSRRLTEDGIKSVLIMGGLSREEKDGTLDKFRKDNKINVLLSSEVGAEGLDLQFSKIEFNYDLPWNPMRLEQRMGRIDRIGQKSDKIFIINMLCENTIEDRVLFKLYDKINIFKESIGDLNEILGKQTQNIEMSLLSLDLTTEQEEDIANQLINIFENNILETRKLEESAGLSKAYSDVILDYVNKAEKNNRYIRKEDLTNYLSDFVSLIANGTRFLPAKEDYWALKLSPPDEAEYRDFLRNNNLIAPPNDLTREVLCSFPQGKRTINSGALNIDVNHSLIKWAYEETAKYFKKNSSGRCYNLQVSIGSFDSEKDQILKGLYVFYVTNVNFEGIKKKNEFQFFVYSLETKQLLEPSVAEFFINSCLFAGSAVSNLDEILKKYDPALVDSAFDVCCNKEFEEDESIISTLEMDSEAIFSMQLERVKTFYENEISNAQKTYDAISNRAENSPDEKERLNNRRILKAQRGRIEKLQRDYDRSLEDLKRKKEKQHHDINTIGCGIVYVY